MQIPIVDDGAVCDACCRSYAVASMTMMMRFELLSKTNRRIGQRPTSRRRVEWEIGTITRREGRCWPSEWVNWDDDRLLLLLLL